MGELGAGVEVAEALVFVVAENGDDAVVGGFLVEDTILDVFCDLLVFFHGRLGHVLHDEEDLREAARAGVDVPPGFHVQPVLHEAVEEDEGFLVEDAGDECEAVGFEVGGEFGGGFVLFGGFGFLAPADALGFEEPGDEIEELLRVGFKDTIGFTLDGFADVVEEGVEA